MIKTYSAARANILGTRVNRMGVKETLTAMQHAVEHRKKLRIAVTPVNCIFWAREDAKLRQIYNTADIVTADGVPVVWGSKWLGTPIRGRVTGLDLLPEFSKIAARNGYSFFFLGAAEGVGEKLAGALTELSPGLKVAGVWSPPFRKTFSDEENREMIDRINRAGADVLWVSLTAPKQDFWIAEHFDKLNVRVAIGVGAAFDVVAGNIPRAPAWMQTCGLEWFYRLMKEPKRLFSRYLIEAPKFIPLIVRQRFSGKS